jgi:hypothetical protein
MTDALNSSLAYFASHQSHQPSAARTAMPRTIRSGVAVAKVGAALAIVATSLGFAALNLGVHPVPAERAVVTPAPHQKTVLGRGSLPALQLPVAVAG